jgi:hypothetical protein
MCKQQLETVQDVESVKVLLEAQTAEGSHNVHAHSVSYAQAYFGWKAFF